MKISEELEKYPSSWLTLACSHYRFHFTISVRKEHGKEMMKRVNLSKYSSIPLEVAEERDVKGLYAKARSGKLNNFTGIDSPYEKPHSPEIIIDTTKTNIDEAASLIVNYYLKSSGA